MSEPAADVDVAAPSGVEEITLTADRLTWEAGRFRAEGNVVVTAGGTTLRAERAEGNPELIELHAGRWERADGSLHFELARVRVRARGGVLHTARVERDGASLTAAQIDVADGQSELVATDARLEPCACPDGGRPALSFRARRLTLLDTDVAVIEGGTVRVFDVPLVPVPWWREPLDPRRFRLEIPEVGYGTPGWSARWHGRVGVGDSRIEFGPAWRQDRGGRVELAVSGPAQFAGEVGWDAMEERVRGAVATSGGASPGAVRVAWDATVQSDEQYAEDLSPSFVDRGVLWYDRRALAAFGPLRAVGWLPSDDSPGTLAELSLRPEWRRGGVALAPRLVLAARRPEEAPEAVIPALRAGAEGRASATADLFHGEITAEAAVDPLALGAGPSWGGLARAELPLWVGFAGGRAQLYAGARAGWAEGDPLDLVASPWGQNGIGPSVRATAAWGQLLLSGEAAALYDGDWSPLLSGQVSGESLSARAELSDTQALAALRTHGVWSVEAGALSSADTSLGWADLTWHPGRLVLGGGVTQGFAPDALPTGVARVGYDDGCSALLVTAGFTPDRTLPDVGLRLQLRK